VVSKRSQPILPSFHSVWPYQRFLRLDPTPHLCFVAQVLFTKLALQIALLTLDNATLDYEQRNRQKKDSPQRVREASDACKTIVIER
jgi:hypothetical protein